MSSKVINAFPGYTYEYQEKDKQYHNMYRGVDVGKGGFVYSEPGLYHNVALLDIASMHPHSIIAMNYFGEYTQNYKDLLDARLAIKHRDFESAKKMLNGKLAKYLTNEDDADALSKALKLPLNATYGLSSAKFTNALRDPRNDNNIVALRGALFMKTLQDELESKGYTIMAIRTDSIKIVEADLEIIEFCYDFAKKYGYTFEHECSYEKICQVNDAVYIAQYATIDKCNALYGEEYVNREKDILKDNKKKGGKWTATGKQFQVPYVFKTLFSKEPIVDADLCETFSVTNSALYLDMNESLPDVTMYEKEVEKLETKYKKGLISDTTFESECSRLNELIEKGHDYKFVGRVGSFCPIKPGKGGGVLVRQKGSKFDAATGSKGYRWLESELVMQNVGEDKEKVTNEYSKECIDMNYYIKLVDDAVEAISKYGDFEQFISDDISPVPLPKPKDPYNFMNTPIDADEEIPFDEEPLPF